MKFNHRIFRLRKVQGIRIAIRQVWFVAIAVAVVTAGPVAFLTNSVPWLIAVPIVGGALTAASLGLIRGATKADSRSGERN